MQQVAYVADLDGDGRNEVIALAGHLGGTRWGFLILDGQTGHLRASFTFNQGQFGYSRFCGAFASKRPGQQAWEFSLATAPSAIVTGDVDGDGHDEFLFGGQDGNLYVCRDAGDHPEEVWRKSFDGPVGTLLLADINGDGKSEIIVSIGDGNLVVLG